MQEYVPVVKIRGVQIWRDAATNRLYVYGGPGRSEWLPIDLVPDPTGTFHLVDLRAKLAEMGLLESPCHQESPA